MEINNAPAKSNKSMANKSRIIYTHDVQTMPGLSGVKGFENCPERSLIMARKKNDIVILNNAPDEGYLQHLEKINLGPSIVIWLNSNTIKEGVEKTGFALGEGHNSPFYSSETDREIAKDLNQKFLGANEDIIMKYYDKGSFKQICSELGLKTASGELFKRSKSPKNDEKTLNQLIDKYIKPTGEVVIRETTMSGGWLVEFINPENRAQAVKRLLDSDGKKFLVEEKLELVDSPCVIGTIDNGKYEVFASSSQLLEGGTSYIGSLFNYKKDLEPNIKVAMDKICNKMIEDGYNGAFGVDFLKTKDDQYLLCECNARINGSFYPHELHQRIQENGNNFPIVLSFPASIQKFKNFDEFQKHPGIEELLYKGGSTPGIVPFETYKLPHGKISCVAVANSVKEAQELADKFKNAFKK